MGQLTESISITNKTAFLLGNGPSLRNVSLPDLSDHATIGMNAAYRYWRTIDWRPRFYICLDLVVGLSHKKAIAELIKESRIERFLLRNNLIEALRGAAQNERVVNFDSLHASEEIFNGPSITTGSGAALWAASMGFDQLIVLGVDARYKEFVAGSERRDGIELEIVEKADNPNYFFDGYQQPGDRYNIPNPRPDLHVIAWREAGVKLAGEDVCVYNANPQSAVQCFPFIDINAFLSGAAAVSPAGETLPKIEFPVRGQTGAPGGQNNALTTANLTRSAKLKKFIKSHALLFAALATLFSGTLLSLLHSNSEPILIIAFLITFAVIFAILLLQTYTRNAVIDALDQQRQEADHLRARIVDLERRLAGKNRLN